MDPVLKPLVFDSSALLTYFLGEQGTLKVQKLLKAAVHGTPSLLLSPINLGEVHYIVSRRDGLEKANEVLQMLEELFFEFPPVDRDTSVLAAELKERVGLGYADAFAAALTLRVGGELVTCDQDFRKIEKEIPIHWI
jgi:predicted nucleic acid-binding protein